MLDAAWAVDRALVCCRCNTDKGSIAGPMAYAPVITSWDARADHVAAFIERGPAT